MANNDDDDKRGSRDNTGRDHKPDHAQNKENAPQGHLGTNRLGPAGLSLGGTGSRKQATQDGEQTQQARAPEKDTRPLASLTEDKEVNDHYGKDHRLVSDQERKDMVEKSQSPEKSQGNSKGGMSSQDIFNKMARDRQQERDRGR